MPAREGKAKLLATRISRGELLAGAFGLVALPMLPPQAAVLRPCSPGRHRLAGAEVPASAGRLHRRLPRRDAAAGELAFYFGLLCRFS